MTIPAEQVDAQLDAFRSRACDGKTPYGQRAARDIAAKIREHGEAHVVPYTCPFCNGWHVGHALGLPTLAFIAELLRARSGNVPVPPGTGTTRRQRRRQARHRPAGPAG